MINLAIVIIAYNRTESLVDLLKSLDNAYYDKQNVPLIISIDKSDSHEVERIADSFIWKFGKKKVVKHKNRLGLKNHVLECGNFLNIYDAIIVLEDDLIVSRNFFYYASNVIEKYKNNLDIAGISLYSFNVNYQTYFPFIPLQNEYDIYLMNCAQSWGQIWLKDQWNDFINWYKNIDEKYISSKHFPEVLSFWPDTSWLKYHTCYCIDKNKYFVYPYTSLTTNVGYSGTNKKEDSSFFQVKLQEGKKKIYKIPNSTCDLVKYDGFFENKGLNVFLHNKFNINVNEICVDLNGMKNNKDEKRFWLSTKQKNFKIIYSYGLKLKPIESNIFNDISGNEIFLYDTKYKQINSFTNSKKLFNYQHSIYDLRWLIKKYGLFKLIVEFLKNKINYIF